MLVEQHIIDYFDKIPEYKRQEAIEELKGINPYQSDEKDMEISELKDEVSNLEYTVDDLTECLREANRALEDKNLAH